MREETDTKQLEIWSEQALYCTAALTRRKRADASPNEMPNPITRCFQLSWQQKQALGENSGGWVREDLFPRAPPPPPPLLKPPPPPLPLATDGPQHCGSPLSMSLLWSDRASDDDETDEEAEEGDNEACCRRGAVDEKDRSGRKAWVVEDEAGRRMNFDEAMGNGDDMPNKLVLLLPLPLAGSMEKRGGSPLSLMLALGSGSGGGCTRRGS